MTKLHFLKEKETKNTVKFVEQPAAGQPPIIGALYVQKWFASGITSLYLSLDNGAAPQPTAPSNLPTP